MPETETATAIIRGTNDKPAATQALVEMIGQGGYGGQLLVGYPVTASADARQPVDAVLITPGKGVVVFDLVDGSDLTGHEERQDEIVTRLEQRLLGHRDLVRRRKLLVTITPVTFGPGLPVNQAMPNDPDYRVATRDTLDDALASIEVDAEEEIYERTLSAIQNISTIRRSRAQRETKAPNSRGARLKQLEASIATLDNLQSKAVIETVDGVQRIRGLAGSGKTIILALKAAYLHATHPDWRIAVTFNTRSLKAHFQQLITGFTIEQTGEEPDWSKVRIVNSWGAPGGDSRSGLYYEFCRAHDVTYYDFSRARGRYGYDNAFGGACQDALNDSAEDVPLYQAILVDEAQDLPPSFLRLCYQMLDEHHRLVYAYDELQTLSGEGMASVDEIFGVNHADDPVVSFEEGAYDIGARRDIVLEKCYRNSRPVLVSAHALGFGIYRKPEKTGSGLVQMFDQSSLWTDIGYHVQAGTLEPGDRVVLERTDASSPGFLEEHSPIDDLIQFIAFDTAAEQNEWVAAQIESNLTADELRYDDIVVINTDPFSTRKNLGPLRRLLLERGIQSHLAGVDVLADVFFNPNEDSITFSGIYRAKGNEAGMIYIVNANEAHTSALNLARVRNRLFTAITRSKAWVRVVGHGAGMQQLISEYNAVRSHDFTLDFRYPTEAERAKLEVIHRDATAKQVAGVRKQLTSAEALIAGFESGQIYLEDLSTETRNRLIELLSDGGGA